MKRQFRHNFGICAGYICVTNDARPNEGRVTKHGSICKTNTMTLWRVHASFMSQMTQFCVTNETAACSCQFYVTNDTVCVTNETVACSCQFYVTNDTALCHK